MKDENEIGVLWSKKSVKGNDYMTGNITVDGKEIRVVVFGTGEKKNPKSPDWKILIAKPKEERQSTPSYNQDELPVIDVQDDSIPF